MRTTPSAASTDRARLAGAFSELRQKRYLARMSFLCCGTCASYALHLQAKARFAAGERVSNIVFWHEQSDDAFDAAGRIEDDLWLHHGLVLVDDDDTVIYESDKESTGAIVETLRRHGLDATWSNNNAECIRVRHSDSPDIFGVTS